MARPDIFHLARNARLYRVAAKDLRRCAAGSQDRDARETLLLKARRMEKRARAYETLIVRYADAVILLAPECA